MPEGWKSGSTRAWREVRGRVLAAAEYRCQVRYDAGCTGQATHVHHTVGKSVSGDDPRYLQASCNYCNRKMGDPRRNDPAPTPKTRW